VTTSDSPAPAQPTVLVVEDQPQMMRFLRTALPAHGLRVVEAVNGQEAILKAASHTPDVVLLDLGLPDMDGVEVARRLREWSTTPVIVLSARGQEQDKIAALDAGADDYLTKPFGVGELFARIRVALRNAARVAAGGASAVFERDELRVDLGARRVTLAGTEVHLTRNEYRLLTVLVKNAGRVVTHRQLLREVWGPSFVDHNHYVRVFMAQLRRKLEREPAQPHYIATEVGVGYRLKSE
jgi:two-component system KDP operon response regulator KdpE